MCDEYQFYVENMQSSRIGVTFTTENVAVYYLKLPLIFNSEEHDQEAGPLLRLKKIYFGKELEMHDGQECLLRYIIPLCDKYEITYEWMPRL
jgi:hypothetical protein